MAFGFFCAGSIHVLTTSRIKVELVDQTSIGHLAFEIGETLGHERRCHELGWHRRQAESLELGYIAPRAVAHLQITHSFVARSAANE
jgi:hypothetical protein